MRNVSLPNVSQRPVEAFRIEIQPARHRVFVAPHGELDIATAADLDAEVGELVKRGFTEIVVDLRGTSFIDSTGLHLLLRQTARTDARITVIDGPPVVSRVFDLAGVRDALRFETAP
jgi:anti-sigma B factor antagonist